MLTIDNKETADEYTAELTMESQFGGRLVYVVANASVRARYRPLVELGGTEHSEYGQEILVTPQSGTIDKISAVKFRSAVAGQPGRIIAQLSEPGDILPAAGTPFTQSLAGSGAVGALASARVFSSVNVSIPNNADTAVNFNSERFDPNDMWVVGSPSRLTVPAGQGGRYLLIAHGEFEANAIGQRRIWIRLNGATKIGTGYGADTAGTATTELGASTVYDLVEGDYVEMVVFQNSGAARNLLTVGNFSPEFMAVRLA